MRLWETVLTPEERKRLGDDPLTAFDARGVLGTWIDLRGGEPPRVLAELALNLDLISERDLKWLLRELGEPPAVLKDPEVPTWNREKRELWYRGNKIRTIASLQLARNVTLILDAFEEQSWPCRIDDPLPGGRNQTRLHGAIASLNKGLKGIEFHSDGSGEGVEWRPRSI